MIARSAAVRQALVWGVTLLALQQAGEWRLEADRSPRDAKLRVTLSRDAEHPARDAGRISIYYPTLNLRCIDETETEVFIGVERERRDNRGSTATLTLRFDDEAPTFVAVRWRFGGRRGPVALDEFVVVNGEESIRAMLEHRRVQMTLRPGEGGSLTTTFDLSGIGRAIDRAGDPCGWT